MQSVQDDKGARFFKYLLELNNLVGKVDRDYRQYEKIWEKDSLESLEGIRLFDECLEEDHVFEIDRPSITDEDKRPPEVPTLLVGWINGLIDSPNNEPVYYMERKETDEEGESHTVSFEDDKDRVKAYDSWKKDWHQWAEQLKEKYYVSDLYNNFFHFVSRFDQEGDTLEFIYGRGILTWMHKDKKIGSIRHPLITTKLELELLPRQGRIVAKESEDTVKVERDMFSGVQLPNRPMLDKVIESMREQHIGEDFEELFEQFITLIHPDGVVRDENQKMEISATPAIYDKGIFSVRGKKVRVLREDLEQIIEGVEEGSVEMTQAVASIFEGEAPERSDIDKEEEKNPLPKDHLYFPLPANEQQKNIVNRIDKNYGVTVQGPPGTGKTHTIANLVSHFLSQGKRILITSQKENALKVLKDKIPESIRDLCVPVLGSGRESMDGIEKSIRTLSEQLGELDKPALKKTIDHNLELLDESKREEARLTNELKVYTEKEGTPLTYGGEKLHKYDVAKQLAGTDIDYSWIKDDVGMEATFPLSKEEWTTFWTLKNRLEKEELSLRDKRLPSLDAEIMSVPKFNDLVEEVGELDDYEDAGQRIIEAYQLKEDREAIGLWKARMDDITSFQPLLEKKSSRLMLDDLKAGGSREARWRDLHKEQEENVQKLFELYNELITHDVQLPEKSLKEIEEDVRTAKEPVEEGKKPSFFFFLFKGKNTKYLFENQVLNGKPLETAEDFAIIERYLEYAELKAETARVVNGNLQEIGAEEIDQRNSRFPHEVEEALEGIRQVIEYVDEVKQAEQQLSVEVDFYDFGKTKSFREELDVADKYVALNHWRIRQKEETAKMKELSNEEEMHPIIHEFILAMASGDKEKWEASVNQLLHLGERKKLVREFYSYLDKLKQTLPATAAHLESTVGQETEMPEDYKEALENQKLQTWLDETKDVNVARLKDKLEEQHKEQKRLIREVVTASTWKSQMERITDEEKRALSSWKTYIKRYGKGTGKSAQRNLKGARESMKTAQGAIPVWIMPVNQVLENFPVTNDKFDVIIFDESSQCDLFSTNVLMRGEKMIVVGDEEQISPQAIGTKDEDVQELVRRYLQDVPNANLFDGNISLYEMAEQTFPKEGKLMLREHFRCVPEIIQFSNDLSYGGEMIPLRLPVEEEKLEPPVLARKVEDGHNDDGDKDINNPEADKIAADMKQMVEDPAYDGQTFGVIALQGGKQAQLLETKLREAIGDEEFVNRKVICGDAYTLQGDERDVVFLSMVVAPERRFRSLTKNSEKQRINVAASRAKNQMRLYHSVDTNDLKPDDFRYQLLSYCKNPSRVADELENLEQYCDSPFEVDVLRAILAKGYKVTPQVKVGRYRIDLVVEGMRNRLAVECDGERWHGPEKFEEDMIRQESLERAGWEFWRVRGRDFYLNKKESLESLWEKLDEMGIEPKIYEQV
ncbi:AAA domain-containing protein [Salimicrobium flavidum]|uniref:Superfamily I DNA and/or RNA helicase n=1 Tax=Salimicrobium flavidum TaxID=570947 RepID=A0A1N7K1Z2_9BACI|nr:AAA domain-containing protein [Salimicrobium flavidum]SIS55577.1 Superfamily I DNA and/or RNA helicase [Salimicrobium flavidum]